eukprot:TRINITY_DN1937_c0_g1_i6.p1 TRINITY_DN1937_c0_g1~~TRINITY_DN1937_c0_g1_i6.p1  ORF type:complete len:821 (-),score=173.64 TRINITY_DN1937_c0_g1_i6:449-2911(-)
MKFLVCLAIFACLMSVSHQQVCTNIPPDTTFPCEYWATLENGCDPKNLRNEAGELVYCLESCNLCGEVDLAALPTDVESQDIFEELAEQGGTFAAAEGKAFSLNQYATDVKDDLVFAIVELSQQDLGTGAERKDKVVDAAVSRTEVVSTAIAQAMSRVSLRGVTSSLNSRASGVAIAQAEAIANATASAYAVAVAEAEGEFTELEASTFITDVQKALTETMIDFSISGESEVTVQQEAYATAVAESVAIATAQVFASVTETDSQAIALATAQAFNTSQITCLSFCNQESPTDESCQSYVDSGRCGEIPGFCECLCGTCQVGSESSVATFVEIISKDDATQTVNAIGDAFSEGAKGANAVASAFVQAVAKGDSEVVTSAIAEAFGAQELQASAIAESITQAINQGGDDVVIAVADAFALAESGGYSNALAEAIADAWSSPNPSDPKASAMTQAIASAISDGNCEALSTALATAASVADGQGTGDAFAASLAESQAINSCFQGSQEEASVSYTDSYAAVTSEGVAELAADAISNALAAGDANAAASTMAQALNDGRSAAVSEAIARAIAEGASTETIVDAVTQVIAQVGEIATQAVASGFAMAETDSSEALSAVFASGVLAETPKSTAVTSAISSAVSTSGCPVFAQSLALAQSKAGAMGEGEAFTQAFSGAAIECLAQDLSLAEKVQKAVVDKDLAAMADLATQASASAEVAAFVEGLASGKGSGADCGTIMESLKLATDANMQGLDSAVAAKSDVANCVGYNFRSCQGSVLRNCCSDYPDACSCRISCRTKKNFSETMPMFGLYVYTDIGNRQCKCPMTA